MRLQEASRNNQSWGPQGLAVEEEFMGYQLVGEVKALQGNDV